jgi:hypothetical protein
MRARARRSTVLHLPFSRTNVRARLTSFAPLCPSARVRPTLEELTAALDIQDAPFLPPRFEPWRLMERVIANCAAVFVWVGVWDQIDMNVLPLQCSYNACGRCYKYGQFPCAWCEPGAALRSARVHPAARLSPRAAHTHARLTRYKILFIVVGLIGQFFTRGLYTDSEVTYARRGGGCPCCGGRLKPVSNETPPAQTQAS